MEIICAGYPKTCSKSCSSALRLLGYNVADLAENIHFLSEVWFDYIHGKCSIHKYGFQANQDVPSNVHWEALFHASPNSKVILTVRDNTEVWRKSFIGFLKQENLRWGNPGFWIFNRITSLGWTSPNMNRYFLTTHEIMKKKFFRNCDHDFYPAPWNVFTAHQLIKIMEPYWEASVDQYEAHIRRVKEVVPKDRLLIWNVKDGWEPVCKFLGKPVPNIPIPHDNKTGDTEFIKKYLVEGAAGKEAQAWSSWYMKKALCQVLFIGGLFIYEKKTDFKLSKTIFSFASSKF
ncbi:unnamed protein product [Oikopleura dioica]|uniref:Sulfotransferase n=1 Tax=Oikopleura dioica TaxID=34765 RepID=E4Y4X9_OIKDI|nr:unnamed protein product [Oikopleura dioica]